MYVIRVLEPNDEKKFQKWWIWKMALLALSEQIWILSTWKIANNNWIYSSLTHSRTRSQRSHRHGTSGLQANGSPKTLIRSRLGDSRVELCTLGCYAWQGKQQFQIPVWTYRGELIRQQILSFPFPQDLKAIAADFICFHKRLELTKKGWKVFLHFSPLACPLRGII